MNDISSTKILGKIGFAILAIALVDLFFLNYWVVANNQKITSSLAAASEMRSKKPEPQASSSTASSEESPLPSPSPVEVAAVQKTSESKKTETVVQTAQKEIFIPMGSASTKSDTYADLLALEVKIDPTKYSNIDSIVFEAALSVDGGNGRAWAQLYVVEDKNPLIESQISNPTSTPTVKTSGNIPYPGSAKTYRVQAKTELVDYAAHVENARLKVTLK